MESGIIWIALLLAITGVYADEGCDAITCANGGTCVFEPNAVACACQAPFSGDRCTDVLFPSGLSFAAFDESALDDTTALNYYDTMQTGGILFNVSDAESDLRLTLNTLVRDYQYDDHTMFRTHPTFVQCVQKVITFVKNVDQIDVVIDSAYRPHSTLTDNSVVDLYAASGTGVVLTTTDDVPDTDDLMKIVDASLAICATNLFSAIRRQLGLRLLSGGVHMHMSEVRTPDASEIGDFTVDSGSSSGYTSATFQTYCLDKINEALKPVQSARCRNRPYFNSADVYPSTATSAEDAVGTSDTTPSPFPSDEPDYGHNLVIYPGSNVGLNDSNWMSPRMYDVIRKLQAYVDTNTSSSDSISISRLHQFSLINSLYLEGRRAYVAYQSGSSDGDMIQLLGMFAVCSGADYVSLQDDYIIIAVTKQSTIRASDSEVSFANAEALLAVTPPTQPMAMHAIGEAGSFPLFDSSYQTDSFIGEETTVGRFASNSSRYLRLDPALAACYDEIVLYDTKWNGGELIPITVVTGYLTRNDFVSEYPSAKEYAHFRGVAMVLRYDADLTMGEFATNNAIDYSMMRLSENAIKLCGPIFQTKNHMSIGIDVTSEGVYIDIRDQFSYDIEEEYLEPYNDSVDAHAQSMEELYEAALDERIVNPELPVRACERDYPPQVKSVNYRYEHPAHIERRRRRRDAGEEEDTGCEPARDTEFCSETESHRAEQIDFLWTQFNRMHFYHDEYELRLALEGCFDNCGTCLLGEVYEEKTEHCSNLLHWLPHPLMNEAENSTHLYDPKSSDMKRLACLLEGQQCIFNAPLYAILATSIESLYRPDPTRSVEEQLYSQTENPLPVYDVLHPMFGINARGIVHVWVASREEITNLRPGLKAVMLYNRMVTHVYIMVDTEEAMNSVSSSLDTMLEDWKRTGCPLNSRAAIVPYTLMVVPDERRVERSIADDGFSFGEELIRRHTQFEMHWRYKMRT